LKDFLEKEKLKTTTNNLTKSTEQLALEQKQNYKGSDGVTALLVPLGLHLISTHTL